MDSQNIALASENHFQRQQQQLVNEALVPSQPTSEVASDAVTDTPHAHQQQQQQQHVEYREYTDKRKIPRNSGPVPVFNTDEIVWARTGNRQPYWPSQVLDPSQNEQLFAQLPGKQPQYLLVRFFGTYDYSYVSPWTCVLNFDQNYAERQKKSRAKQFVKAVQEANNMKKLGVLPEEWQSLEPVIERPRGVLPPATPVKKERPVSAFGNTTKIPVEVGNAERGWQLIEHHEGFTALPRLTAQNSLKAKKRRERQLKVMRKLVLCSPEL